MKKYLLFLIFSLFILITTNLYSQSGWVEGNYYAEQGTTQVVCGDWYTVWIGYDAYGRQVFVSERQCKVEQWYSKLETCYGYFWDCDNYGYCQWQYKSGTLYWWHFLWYYYKERL